MISGRRFLVCVSLFVTAAALPPARTSAAAVAPEAPMIPWTWSAVPDHYPLVDLTARIRHQRYSLHEEAVPGKPGSSVATLSYYLEKGGIKTPVWQVTVPDAGGGNLAGAAMVLSNTQLFVARYHRISTGCTLYAFSVEKGILQWKVFLEGIGPIGHSKWHNRVQLSTEGNHPVVFGLEGRNLGYIEQRDAATGALLSNRKLKDLSFVQPLAEPLYVELQNMLQQQPTYQVKTSDFLKRHGMKPERLPELITAVQQVNEQPVLFGRYFIAAQLRKQDSGEQVIEVKRR